MTIGRRLGMISFRQDPWFYPSAFGTTAFLLYLHRHEILHDTEAITIEKARENRQVTELIGVPTGGRDAGESFPIPRIWKPITKSFILYGPSGTGLCQVSLARRGSVFVPSTRRGDWEIVRVQSLRSEKDAYRLRWFPNIFPWHHFGTKPTTPNQIHHDQPTGDDVV